MDREDPPEKGKAAHSRILAWRIPWAGQSVVSPRVGHDWETFTFTSYFPRKVLLWSRKNVSKEITLFPGKPGNFIIELLHKRHNIYLFTRNI